MPQLSRPRRRPTFANITIVSTPANHFPIGTLDCNGSGCHTTTNVNAGGFKLGSASIATPTLNGRRSHHRRRRGDELPDLP